uniref:Uncharacterized protein n=1 Tax=Leersia perrieri TaxID=77586 RepID=A0A0D9VGV3_9ORYZ
MALDLATWGQPLLLSFLILSPSLRLPRGKNNFSSLLLHLSSPNPIELEAFFIGFLRENEEQNVHSPEKPKLALKMKGKKGKGKKTFEGPPI